MTYSHDEAELWKQLEREEDARQLAIREQQGRIVDLNVVERRTREILAEMEA